MSNSNLILLLSDASGIYTPQRFAKEFTFGDPIGDQRDVWTGVFPSDLNILRAGPDYDTNPEYWETWDTVLQNAKYTCKETGKVYNLHQDGDLWGLCYDHMTEEEKENFGFND